MKRILSIISAAMLLFSLVGCDAPQEAAKVAATTLPVYEFTQRLCNGTGITVTRLVTENVSCLHDYSLSVRQVKAVESAELVILSGGGLEDFMTDLLGGAAGIADSSEGIAFLGCRDHDHGHRHHHDPHIWLSPAYAKHMANNICQALAVQYPQHNAALEQNLTGLLQDLNALEAYGRQQLKDLSCRELITFHDGFAYFAQAFDLTVLKAVEEESGNEASAQTLKELTNLVRSHSLPAIFTERSGSVSAAGVLAAETGVSVYALDMAMAGDSYFDAMYHNINTVKEALG